MKIRKLAIIIYILGFLTFSFGSVLEVRSESYLMNSKKQYDNLFENDSPKSNVTVKDIDKVSRRIERISDYNKNEKSKMLDDLKQYKRYVILKQKVLSKYTGNNIVSTLTSKEIDSISKEANDLDYKYQEDINSYVMDMSIQKRRIDNVQTKISNLYEDKELKKLKENIAKEDVDKLRIEVEALSQKDIIKKSNKILDNTVSIIEERIKQEEIRKAWVDLKVPYISQTQNNILNGCEAASLLMGLQYKGYLNGTTLYDYATNMPKSTDPYKGFTYDIYKLEPYDVPHWIAPSALAKYGRDSSGNQNVVDGTGMSLDELDRELDNNNTVVIYLTGSFKPLKEWKEGAPINQHVLLLTGYNKITGQHIITDPWTRKDGSSSWILERSEIESIYDAIGRKNVIIR